MKIKPYIFNGFLLVTPVLVWNVFLTRFLPWPFNSKEFSADIPNLFLYAELLFRALLFLTIFLMPLKTGFKKQVAGWCIYATGLLLYGLSWIFLINCTLYFPDNTTFSFLLPSLTPVVWIAGIIMVTDNFSFGLPYNRIVPILVSLCFLFFHNLNIILALGNLY
ncbi:hypothetical protein [Sphingobacterium corticibacterium]|uniref:Uncharacterized protein n=1 Tax=Sphingobacterium corticibacterium TaxID=2484746 RepID=A0A4Q6XWT8_9SPHI|nr:hypothetical protein [Sphingobacterium corticibacterium]RZF62222.1 hypothetical protein EWE74_05310 [Sphingobacterium corticibacterium]